MKVTTTIKRVPVTTYEEQETVNIELNKDQAILLYCLIGTISAGDLIVIIKKSIDRYNPCFADIVKPYITDYDSINRFSQSLYYGLMNVLK